MDDSVYWQQRADYTIHVSLDTATHLLSGTTTIRYTNNSPDTLRYVWLHLEQNLLRPDSRGAAMNAPPNNQGMHMAGEWFESTGITVTIATAVRSPPGGDAQRTPFAMHVNGTMEDALGEDLSWFWRGVFYRTDVVDLAVDSVVTAPDTTGRRMTRIHLASRGGLPMPVAFRITFADGTTEAVRLPVEIWYRGNRYVYAREFRVEVTRVEIDPEQVLPDVRRENNVWSNPPWPGCDRRDR